MWKFRTLHSLSSHQYKEVYQTLPPVRKARIDRMQNPNDKRRSLLASFLVGELLGIFPSPLENQKNGKPFLLNSLEQVSIAHSENGVVCAVSKGPVGVDIERVRPYNPNLIPYFCTPQEALFITKEKEPQKQQQRFWEVWGAKEAYLKQQGATQIDFKSINTLSLPVTFVKQEDYVITLLYGE